jgi:hypothetical protein
MVQFSSLYFRVRLICFNGIISIIVHVLHLLVIFGGLFLWLALDHLWLSSVPY